MRTGLFDVEKSKIPTHPLAGPPGPGWTKRPGPTEFAHALVAKLHSVVGLKAACMPGFGTTRNTPATQHLRQLLLVQEAWLARRCYASALDPEPT
jgi:hypothetical protein